MLYPVHFFKFNEKNKLYITFYKWVHVEFPYTIEPPRGPGYSINSRGQLARKNTLPRFLCKTILAEPISRTVCKAPGSRDLEFSLLGHATAWLAAKE